MDRKVEYNSSKLVKRLISLSPDCAASKVDAGIFRFQTSGKGHDYAELYARLESLPTSTEPALQPGESHTRLTYNRAAVDMFDKAMMDAIYTLWLERPDKSKDECEMSYISIYGKICGRDMICVSEIMKNRLKESLRKLQHIEATLVIANDNPRVLEYFAKNTLAKEYTLKSTLIKCEEYSTLLPNKERIYGINLLKCPILYRYAEAQRQLRGIEFDWLNIGGNMSLKKLGVRDMPIILTLGSSKPKVEIPDDLATTSNTTSESLQEDTSRSAIPFVAIIAITVIAVVGIAVVSILKIRKDKKNGFSNNLFN